MSNILLINPSYIGSYGSAKASLTNPIHPTLGLATIAAVALERKHSVNILDLSYRHYDFDLIKSEILRLKPDIVGITATTPLMNQLRDISVLCKDISKNILIVGGGSHVSAMPVESMKESMLDIILAGEADITFGEICDGSKIPDTLGVYYRDTNNEVIYTGERPLIENLDSLPIPAWHLYDPKEYEHRMSRLLARKPPVTMAEFSRGCVYQCDFCASKMTMALGYRKKSPERCAEEVKIMHKQGWREFMLADDIFTSDHSWAVKVCNEISKTKLKMAWSCTNGIRVESADDDLFRAMKNADCYRVSFGFESGNDKILKAFGKGGKATIDQGQVAVKKARAAGIDTNGFFMLGLSPDSEETMQETIEFARTLELDMLKFGIAIAFPGTPMFNEYAKENLVKSYDWDEYHIYTEMPLFSHRNLEYETILKYMGIAYKRAILTNPGFMIRRFIRGIKTGEFFWDAYYAVKFALLPATSETTAIQYYAKARWPIFDFKKYKLEPAKFQKAKKIKEQPIKFHSPPQAAINS
jgi:radical SAM superfamily enzyme YgiQ (UPF0313 family)